MDLFDSWLERGGAVGAAITAARIGFWLWRRKAGAPTPFFGWLGRRIVVESLLITMTIRYKTAEAKVQRLEQEIEAAGIRTGSGSDPSAGRSFDLPGSTLVRSRPPTSKPSPSTSAKPGSDPP